MRWGVIREEQETTASLKKIAEAGGSCNVVGVIKNIVRALQVMNECIHRKIQRSNS